MTNSIWKVSQRTGRTCLRIIKIGAFQRANREILKLICKLRPLTKRVFRFVTFRLFTMHRQRRPYLKVTAKPTGHHWPLFLVESQISQFYNMRAAQSQNIVQLRNMILGMNPGRAPSLRTEHLKLTVSRSNIVQDTINQIERIIYTESEGVGALRRPLFVQFEGEEARDANPQSEAGVRREFFMLLLHNLLDPKYGMIMEDDESHLCWFRDSSVASDDSHRDFFLMGMGCFSLCFASNGAGFVRQPCSKPWKSFFVFFVILM